MKEVRRKLEFRQVVKMIGDTTGDQIGGDYDEQGGARHRYRLQYL